MAEQVLNVFIDTNMLLNFYRFHKDDLEELEKIFALHQYGKVKIWMPKLIKDEFWRNRGKVVSEHIQTITEGNKFNIPNIIKKHEKINELQQAYKEFNKLRSEILNSIENEFVEENLPADLVIKQMLENSQVIEATPERIARGMQRFNLGNPPGKNKSYGDAVNWICLLEALPEGETLYLISQDGDYKSDYIKNSINEFLRHEWQTRKRSDIIIYTRLSEFTSKHFPQANKLAELETNILIDELADSGSFSSSHAVVARLNTISEFSVTQIESILTSYVKNKQVRWIASDTDMREFAEKLIEKVSDDFNQELVEKVKEYIKE
jgi:rRNA-processing protein FCF1